MIRIVGVVHFSRFILEEICHVYLCTKPESLYISMCIGELAVVEVLWCTKHVAVTLGPSHAYECGLEDQ